MFSSVNYRKFDSSRRFGIELEIGESISRSKIKSILQNLSDYAVVSSKFAFTSDNNFWHVKDDATCGSKGRNGPKGVEIASFIGRGAKDLQHIASMAEALNILGCKINEHCGLHIHAEAIDLTTSHVAVILAYWLKIESVLAMSLPKNRIDNEYCKFFLQRCNFPDYVSKNRHQKWESGKLWALLSPTNMNYYENEERRVNLNLINYVRALMCESTNRKTLELRWPEGTLNGLDIKCWTRLFLGFLDNCKNKSMPNNLENSGLDETLIILGLGHENQTFTIFDESLHETKTWFLERIIKYSPKEYVQQAKDILNKMWSPVKKYV